MRQRIEPRSRHTDSARSNLLAAATSLCLFSLILLAGCSETEPTDVGTPFPDAAPALRPFLTSGGDVRNIQNLRLDENLQVQVDAVTLLPAGFRHLMTMNTDAPFSTSASGRNYQAYTSTPEYMVYALNQKVMMMDLSTRQTHELYDFEQGEIRGTVCGLRPVTTLDKLNFDNSRVIYQEELAVYTAIATHGDCNQADAYFRMEIMEAFRKTLRVRFNRLRTKLNSGQAGENLSNKPITDDERPLWWMLANTHLVKNVPEDDSEKIYQLDPPIFEFSVEDIKAYVGQPRTTDPALYHAGRPIIDMGRRQVGFLGYDPLNQELKFFVHDLARKRNTLLWNLFLPAPTDGSPVLPQLNPEAEPFIVEEARPRHYIQRYDGVLRTNYVLVIVGWNVVKMTIPQLFDDYRSTERQRSLQTPYFARTHQADDSYVEANFFVSPGGAFYIIDNNQLIMVRDDGVRLRLSTLAPNTSIRFRGNNSKLFVHRTFLDSDPLEHALVYFEDLQANPVFPVEKIWFPRTRKQDIDWYLDQIGAYPLLNLVDYQGSGAGNTGPMIKAIDFSRGVGLSTELPNSLFVRLLDYRAVNQGSDTESIALIRGTSTDAGGAGEAPALESPNLYAYSITAEDGIVNLEPETGGGTRVIDHQDTLFIHAGIIENDLNDIQALNMPVIKFVNESIIGEPTSLAGLTSPLEQQTFAYSHKSYAMFEYLDRAGDAIKTYDPSVASRNYGLRKRPEPLRP